MYNDVARLTEFYASPLGGQVRLRLAQALQPYHPRGKTECVVGLGFALPYLEPFMEKAERCFALMPARQGAMVWPNPERVASALVFEEDLPLPLSSVDRLLLVHALEGAENASETLRELWRVLVPGGQLIVVVANRRGPWAGADHTAFGNGEPYSRGQLLALLQTAGFSPLALHEAVHFWPRKDWQFTRSSRLYERLACRLIPYLGGVLVAQGQKKVVQGIPVLRLASRRVFIPALATPQNARTG